MALTVLAGVVFAVLAIRALRCPSRQPQVVAAPRPVLDETGAVARLSQALQFETVSAPAQFKPETFLQFHQFLEEAYPETHATLKREVVGDYSLLYRWAGRDAAAPAILLMSHLDVVPVTRADSVKWSHDAWSGAVIDGYIWGRGALDVKCGVMSLMEAVEHLVKRGFRPQQDVYLAFGHDEEIGGAEGNLQIALKLRQRGVRLRMVLDEGGAMVTGVMPGLKGPLALVAVAEKGYATVKLEVHMPGGHASMPPLQTAIGIVAAAVARLEAQQRPTSLAGPVGSMLAYVAPETPPSMRLLLANRDVFSPLLLWKFQQTRALNALVRTTTAATVIRGGQTENALASDAKAIMHFRLLPGDTPELVLEHVKQTVDDERVTCTLQSDAWSPSGVSDHRSEDFALLQRTIRQIEPTAVAAPGLATVATDSRHYENLAENVFRFLPLRLTADDLKRIHGVDERIAIDNYLEMVQFMMLLLENAASEEK